MLTTIAVLVTSPAIITAGIMIIVGSNYNLSGKILGLVVTLSGIGSATLSIIALAMGGG